MTVDATVRGEEVERLMSTSDARRAAQTARQTLEAEGIARGLLAPCEAEASDGTRLAGCLKARVPLGRSASSKAPLGFVLRPAMDADGGLTLQV